MKGSFSKPMKSGSLPLALLFIFASAFFWGCSAAIPYRLDPAASGRIGEVNAEVCVASNSISITVLESSYGAGGGLIGALIDASVVDKRKKEAIKTVAPLKAKTQDINFREALRDALLPVVKELPWPRIIDVKVKAGPAPITSTDIWKQVSESSYLEIHSTYQLSPTAEVLEIATGFSLYLKGNTKAAVAGSVRYSSERIGKLEENDEAIALWAENDAASYRQALKLGVEETVKMLNLALPYAGGKSALRPASEIKKMKIRISHGRGDYGINQPGMTIGGWIVEERENRIIFQSQFSGFISFPKSDIIFPIGG